MCHWSLYYRNRNIVSWNGLNLAEECERVIDLVSDLNWLWWYNYHIIFPRHFTVRLYVPLPEQELCCLEAAWALEWFIYHLNWPRWRISADDHCFCCSFCLHDCCLLLRLCDVNVGNTITLRGQNVSSFLSLGLCLEDHRLLDVVRRLNVLNLISECGNTPVFGLFINGFNDILIQRISLLEGLVKCELTNLRAHGCLCEICDSLVYVLNIIRSFLWVIYLNKQHSVYLKRDIVFRYSNLWLYFDNLFP